MAKTIAAAPFSCPPSSSIFFLPTLSHDSPHPTWNEALFPTGQAAVQPRVENGNANPLVLCEPLRRTLFTWLKISFLPSGWQVKSNPALISVPMARFWPGPVFSDLVLLFTTGMTRFFLWYDWASHMRVAHFYTQDLQHLLIIFTVHFVLWLLKLQDKALLFQRNRINMWF